MAESYLTRKGGGGGAAINADIVPYEVAPGQTIAAGDMVSFGYDKTEYVLTQIPLFNSNLGIVIAIEQITANTFLVFYTKPNNAGALTIATLNSDDTISTGSEVLINSTNGLFANQCKLVKRDANNFLIGYTMISDSYARAATVSISGSTISVGTNYIINNQASSTAYSLTVLKDNPNHAVAAYGDANTMYLRPLTISGTVVTPQTQLQVQTGGAVNDVAVLSTSANNFIFTYTIGGSVVINQGYSNNNNQNVVAGSSPGSYIFSAPVTFKDLIVLDSNHYLLLTNNNTTTQPSLMATLLTLNSSYVLSVTQSIALSSTNVATNGSAKFSAKAVLLNYNKIFITGHDYHTSGYRNTNYILEYEVTYQNGSISLLSTDFSDYQLPYGVAGIVNFSICKINENKVLQIGREATVNTGLSYVIKLKQKIYNTPLDYLIEYLGSSNSVIRTYNSPDYSNIINLTPTKFLISYIDVIVSQRLHGVVVDYNETSKTFTFGSKVQLTTSTVFSNPQTIKALAFTATDVVVFYYVSSTLVGTKLVISGNSITVQSSVTIASGSSVYEGTGLMKINSTNAMVAYSSNSEISLWLVTLSGSSLSVRTGISGQTRTTVTLLGSGNIRGVTINKIANNKYVLIYQRDATGICLTAFSLDANNNFPISSTNYTLYNTDTSFTSYKTNLYDFVPFDNTTFGIVHNNAKIAGYWSVFLTVVKLTESNNALTFSRDILLIKTNSTTVSLKALKINNTNKIFVGTLDLTPATGYALFCGTFDINYNNFPLIKYEKEWLGKISNTRTGIASGNIYLFDVNNKVLTANINELKFIDGTSRPFEFHLLTKSTKLNKTRGNGVAKSAGTAGQVIDVYTK